MPGLKTSKDRFWHCKRLLLLLLLVQLSESFAVSIRLCRWFTRSLSSLVSRATPSCMVGSGSEKQHFCNSKMGRCQKGRLFSSSSSSPSLPFVVNQKVCFFSLLPLGYVGRECVCVCEKVALATHESSAEKLQILFPLKNKKRPCGLTHADQQKHSCFFFYSVCIYMCVYFPFVL